MTDPVYLSKPGVVCAAGSSADALWRSCVAGDRSGIKKVRSLSGKEFFAGRADDKVLHKTTARFDMRSIRLEDAALVQIEQDIFAALSAYGPSRVAVCVGSCDNGTELSLPAHAAFIADGAFPAGYTLEVQGADYAATYVSEKYGIRGPSLAFSTACSSSAGAIIKAAELLKSGLADAVIAGGVDVASDTVLLGFDSLEAVSPEITNPLSANRCGITLGEGAAFFVMTRDASKGGEPVRLFGWGESADAYHMTSPDPSGAGAARAMKAALVRAELMPNQIDYINLHGTGTKFNDAMEAKAVAEVFANSAVSVGSTKPLTGHTLGAAGALEAAICYTALVENAGKAEGDIMLPKHVWDGVRDKELPLLNIAGAVGAKQTVRVKICMSNSFAFGGVNASLVLGLT